MIGFLQFRVLSIFLVFLTGITALVFQNTWHRYLTYLLGAQSQATAVIIAVFLGGMSFGYYLYGILSRRFSNSLFRLYGATELLIGVWAIFSPQIYLRITEVPINGPLAEIAVALMLLGLPAILMGGTLPVLTQALSLDLNSATRTHAKVYGFNTLGAAFGSIGAGFFLLPALGLPLTLFYTGVINIVVGLLFYFSDAAFGRERKSQQSQESPISKDTREIGGNSIHWFWVISFITGFVSIGLETIIIRLWGIAAGSSVYAFPTVVAVFVFCIALGGLLIGCFKRFPFYSMWLLQFSLACSLLFLYRTVDTWPYWAHVIRTMFSFSSPSFYLYYAAMILAFFLLLVIPLTLLGATLPLCFHMVKQDSTNLGRDTGRLYAINTLGCVLGALFPGYYFLFRFDLNEVMQFLIYLVGVSVLLSLVMLRKIHGYKGKVVCQGLSVAFLAGLIYQPLWDNQYYSIGLFRAQSALKKSYLGPRALRYEYDYLFYRDGPQSSVSILPAWENDKLAGVSIQVSGKVDGNTIADFYSQQLLGHYPVLLAERPEKVCVIGFGTGMTVGVVAQYDEVREIDLIEINPMVLEADRFLSPFNYDVLSDPKTIVHNTDALQFFRNSGKVFDVMVSVPSNPWMVGVENLFSREFYEMAYSRLDDRGIFIQWMQGYEFSDATLALVLNPFRSVFPEYHLIQINQRDYAIVGSKAAIGNDRFEKFARRVKRGNRALDDLGLDRIEQFLVLHRMTPEIIDAYSEGAGVHTLENPKLAFWAGKDFFSKRNASPHRFGKKDITSAPPDRFLQQWERFSQTKVQITLPAKLCKLFNSLCPQLELRNFLLFPDDPVSMEYFSFRDRREREVLRYLQNPGLDLPDDETAKRKLGERLADHANHYLTPDGLIDPQWYIPLIESLNLGKKIKERKY